MNLQVLTLDQSYQPVGRVHWTRAVTLVFTSKAEVISYYEETVGSPSFRMQVPSVIRFLKAKRRNKQLVKFSRVNIFIRDKHTCQYCGVKFTANELTYDHVVPRAQGGKTCWENILSACHPCNSRKGGRTPEQARMRTLSFPKKPQWLPTAVMKISGKDVPEAWRAYLYWTEALDEN